MGYTIAIRKKRSSSYSPKKISKEEFEKVIEDDKSLVWLEESSVYNDRLKNDYTPKTVAIWQYGQNSDDSIWIVLNELGTIDFGYRGDLDFSSDRTIQKIFEIAGKLNCFVEGEDGRLFFDPEQSSK